MTCESILASWSLAWHGMDGTLQTLRTSGYEMKCRGILMAQVQDTEDEKNKNRGN